MLPGPLRGLRADRLPGEARAITPDRNDCANKERGGLQEPHLGPKSPVNETSQGERASRVRGWGPRGHRTAGGQRWLRLFIRGQRKDFAPCTRSESRYPGEMAGEFIK